MSAARGVRLVIGFSPGSVSDRVARLIAAPLSHALGEPVEIDRIEGDNGIAAARAVAAAPADGATLFMATLGTHALAPHVARPAPYDPLSDFTPITQIAQAPLLLACHPQLPACSVAELVALAHARPGGITYATSAIGGAPHLAAELFQRTAGVALAHVRYDRTETLYRDLEAGRVSLSFNNIISMLPRCRSGALRALAVTSSARTALAPDVPALAESGWPNYAVTNWLALVAPRGASDARVRRVADAMSQALDAPPLREAFAAAGLMPCARGPDDCAAFLAAELARWKPLACGMSHDAQHRTA